VELVTPHSATRGLYKTSSTATFAINENHSDMVKFRLGDANLHIVLGKLKQICATHTNILADQPQHQQRMALSEKQSSIELQEKKMTILRSLYTTPYRDRKERNPDRVPGTCQWFVSHGHFCKWRDSNSSTILWVSADPGCGKSVLAKHLIDSELPTSASRTTCYFFFKDDFEDQRSAKGAISCLLHQIFVQRPALFSDAIIQRFDNYGEHLLESFLELWETLLMVSQDKSAGEIVCILDAFDECELQARTELTRALCKFFGSPNKSNLKFLLTSRPFGDIRRGFQPLNLPGLPIIHLRGESDTEMEKISKEIDIYIRARVKEIQSSLQLSPDEAKLLLDRMMSTPQRTYLWAYLTLDLVQNDINLDKTGIEKATSSLPKTVDDAYERILARSHNLDDARRLLNIVVAATRPLSLKEMELALGIRKDHQSYESLQLKTEARFREHVRDICGLFVSVTDSKIYLLHQTAKEFLVDNGAASNPISRPAPGPPRWKSSLKMNQAHEVLWQITLWYLRFTDFITNPLTNTAELSGYLEDHFFLDYSANNWAIHFRLSGTNPGPDVLSSLIELCEGGTWFIVYCAINHSRFPEGFTSLLVAAYFGIQPVVARILRNTDDDINHRDRTHGRSALSWAAQNGHSQVVKLLIKGRGGRLLDLARFKSQRGAEIDSVDNFHRTPLSYAVLSQHRPIVELLLQAGAQADREDKSKGSPISYAICSGDEAILRLFQDANPKKTEPASQLTRRLLLSAIDHNDDYLVKRLLETGLVDVNAPLGTLKWTPLYLAVFRGNMTILKLLIDIGKADVNAVCFGWSPIRNAIVQYNADLVRLLLATGKVDLEAKDADGQIPLEVALNLESNDIARMLLLEMLRTKQAAYRMKPSVIIAAAKNGCEEVVEKILELESLDINTADKNGKTALHFAAEKGYVGIVRRLLDAGVAGINSRCRKSETPFSQAVKKGHTEVVRLLVTGQDDVTTSDSERGTAILWAAEAGQEAVLRLLLSEGRFSPDVVDERGRTALLQAAKHGYAKIARLLLETGRVDVNRQDSEGRTSLSWAAGNGHRHVVEVLLQDKSLHINTQDCVGRTAVMWAAKKQHRETVRTLLATGTVDLTVMDGDMASVSTYILRLDGGESLLRSMAKDRIRRIGTEHSVARS